MKQATRISPRDARRAIEREDALLVCAYDDQEKCDEVKIAGSLSFPEFRRKLGSVGKDRKLIFFCA